MFLRRADGAKSLMTVVELSESGRPGIAHVHS
jgi:hypothetical protein